MAFIVIFSNPRSEPAKRGPFGTTYFDGNDLRAHKGGPLVARHSSHRWHINGEPQTYSKLQCDGPLFVFFTDKDGAESRCFGPFSGFSCIDGVAFAGPRIVAFCDQEKEDWYSYDLGGHWASMVVTTEPPSKAYLPTAPAAFPGA